MATALSLLHMHFSNEIILYFYPNLICFLGYLNSTFPLKLQLSLIRHSFLFAQIFINDCDSQLISLGCLGALMFSFAMTENLGQSLFFHKKNISVHELKSKSLR